MERDIPLPPLRRARQPALPGHLRHHSDHFTFDCNLPSSDPPLFSSDDFQSSALENYRNSPEQQEQQQQLGNAPTHSGSSGNKAQTKTKRKRQYRGTWWGKEEGEKNNDAVTEKRRRTEFKNKRNLDSGVWLGSDDSVESALSNRSGLEGNDHHERFVFGPSYTTDIGGVGAATKGRNGDREAGEQQAALLCGPAFARSRQVGRENSTKPMQVDEPYQHRHARQIIADCLETGHEFIDISNLNLRTIPPGLLRPISQFTKYPIIEGMDKISSLARTNHEQFFSSFEPFLCLFMTNNQLKTLPAEVFELSNLRVLSVRHNELEQIPGAIGNLTKLRELNVAGNQLSYLPIEVFHLLQKCDTHMKQLTVHPNPFVMPDSSNVAEWHCHFESDENQQEGVAEVMSPPSSTKICPRSAGSRPIPVPIARGKVQFFDAEGRPIDTTEPTTNSNTSTLPLLPPFSSASASSLRSPSLCDLALRAYNRGPQISHLIDPVTFAGPAIILDLLKHAEKVRDAGGKKCPVCARSFVITRAQWIEWWDCESYSVSRYNDGGYEDDHDSSRASKVERFRIAGVAMKPLPFMSEVCSWGCVPTFESWRGGAGKAR
ncbi:leucine rich repeat domain-containing protein [Histoplasma capsulatum var. duboisii H88]|uniref:Leucine rich repeat domain-containing protein n=1 Tax=Ajellomyces capsulatus (strain H88) TaxID=544711 RepID=F0U6Z4_AJEC8|nr:leucine rich repeat domain-containing protein [Histoplasma capsulatum var. duboisii H88]QSS51234.1 leucine rich repeat domain-containing protein [Histoplasma capsulatum var. duboisii H88]